MNTLKELYQQVKDRPAPAYTRQQLVAMITSASGVLVTLGILPAATHSAVVSWANFIVAGLFVAWGALHTIIALYSTPHTTPVSDPRDNAGHALVPAASSAAITPVSNVTPPTPISEGQTDVPSSTDPTLLPSELIPVEAGGVD